MKKVFIVLSVFFSFQFINAQDQMSQPEDKIFQLNEVDVKPDFPGGKENFFKFIAKNFRAPEEEGLEGKILSTFVIEKDGSITNIKILQDVGFGSGAEVVRVLSLSKKWIPALLNGNSVRFLYQFPITVKTGDSKHKKNK